MKTNFHFLFLTAVTRSILLPCAGAEADLILHNGKVLTVDRAFTVAQAVAVQGNRILQVGPDAEVLRLKGPRTELVDLRGRMVVPGLIDSHAHPLNAALTEFDHPIPQMDTIADVLAYVRSRAQALPEGEWIVVQQVFITRLREQRYPTRAELDQAAPRHPVMFRTGPDASLNSLALRLSGIDKDFKVTDGGSGFAEKDPQTGEPTGILRNCTRYVKVRSTGRSPTLSDRCRRLAELFRDYNAVGLTSVADRDAPAGHWEVFQKLLAEDGLTVRVSVSQHIDTLGPLEQVQANIRRAAEHPFFKNPHPFLRLIGVKTYLDGGMLTGSAYMKQPWGVSELYAIRDPAYRGVLFIPKDRLVALIRTAVEAGLQFTAHSVGDGAVETLVEAYEEVNRTVPVRPTRSCISHANFLTPWTIQKLPELGVHLDVQPAWLYLDTRTLAQHFGYDRLRWFQPWRSVLEAGGNAGGGSDHMQKIGSLRSINLYNPFLGMATAITRRAKWYDGVLHPEEALTRQQAIQLYTINNARLLRCDDLLGSIEPGKLADLVVLDTDLLTCPEEAIARTQVLRTYMDGKLVFSRQ